MPIQKIERVEDGSGEEIGVRFYGVGRGEYLEILYADVPGNSWNDRRLSRFVERAQALIDNRYPITDLPADDPWRQADPALPYAWWDGADIVERVVEIADVSWDGVRLQFALKRAR